MVTVLYSGGADAGGGTATLTKGVYGVKSSL